MSSPVERVGTGRISAIQILMGEDGCENMGLLTQITPNAELRVCGSGFNERTVKVEFEGWPYFVFREDLARLGTLNNAAAAAGR
jgi:hypothetical protein